MPRSRLRPRDLAIAWLVIVAGAIQAVGELRRNTLGGTPFPARPGLDTGSNFAMPNSMNKKQAQPKILPQISGPEILDDPEALINSDSYDPRQRVKRIPDLFDSPPEAIEIPSHEMSSSLRTGHGDASRKVFKRFAIAKKSRANENEADYSRAFDEDEEIEMPRAVLNDELSRKRDFTDIYPEKSSRYNDKEDRKMRYEGDEEREEHDDNDDDNDDEDTCAEDDYENENESYYEDEDKDKKDMPGREDERRMKGPEIEGVSSYDTSDADYRDNSYQHSKPRPIFAVKGKTQLSTSDTKLLPNEEDYPSFLRENERLAAPYDRTKDSARINQIRGINNLYEVKGSKPRQHLIKDKTRLDSLSRKRLGANRDRNALSRLFDRRVEDSSWPREVGNDRRMSKSSVTIDNSNIIHDNAFENKIELSRLKATHRKANGEYCEEDDEDYLVKEIKGLSDKGRQRTNGNYGNSMEMAIGGRSAKDSQLFHNVDSLNDEKDLQNLAKINKNDIRELRSLLGQTIAKVESLHSAMSKVKSPTNNQRQLNSNEKSMRSRYLVDGHRGVIAPYQQPYWDQWTSWTSCSVTCGRGHRSRTRHCLRDCGELVAQHEERLCRFPGCSTNFLSY